MVSTYLYALFLCHVFILKFVEFVVDSVVGKEALMVSLFNDFTLMHYDDIIHISNGGETVCYY